MEEAKAEEYRADEEEDEMSIYVSRGDPDWVEGRESEEVEIGSYNATKDGDRND